MQRSLPIHVPRSQAGFSLVELLVAMMITLIVSGAIYGLMAGGQNAFRREPALVERQQNIRIALDLITRDLQSAGAGITTFSQAFSDGLDNPASSLGSVPSELVSGERADFLEMLVNDGSCPSLSVCGAPGSQIFTDAPLPACMFGSPPGPAFGYVSGTGGPANGVLAPGLLWITPPGPGGGGGCGEGHVGLQPGQGAGINPGQGSPTFGGCGPGGTATTATNLCESVSKISLVRYELAPENPAAALDVLRNPPSLWRSEYGRRNPDGSASVNTGPFIGANSPWQLIARGVDDLQVEYQPGANFTANTWADVPGSVVTNNYQTIVRRVRVTLSARALALNIGGETVGETTNARRGSLTTAVTPRAALLALHEGNQWR
ncbi:MAG: prepilin-type N-terminal cleavage/methylation domain-containing protein [Vicinamibacteria bacterium]